MLVAQLEQTFIFYDTNYGTKVDRIEDCPFYAQGEPTVNEPTLDVSKEENARQQEVDPKGTVDVVSVLL